MRRPRQPLPRGDWAIPGQTMATRMEAIRTEAYAYDIPTFRPNKRGLILAGLCSSALSNAARSNPSICPRLLT